jgi:UDP-glucose 4-epimerase
VRPLSPYGITKLATEKFLFFYKQVYGLDYVVLRYANIYGPRQNPHGEAGVVAIFANKLLKGEQPIINGDGMQTRDYTYVGDVVQANLLALRHSRSDIFNIGTGLETNVNEVFQRLRAHLNSACPERHSPPKEGEQRRSVISYVKAQKEMGWAPSVSLREGLRLTAEYFRKNFR